jgi:hypothetical protein
LAVKISFLGLANFPIVNKANNLDVVWGFVTCDLSFAALSLASAEMTQK